MRKKSDTTIRYQIDAFKDIVEILIPFVRSNKCHLHTQKKRYFEIFEQVATLISCDSHKEYAGWLKIVDLAYNMNFEGKRRKLTAEEYVARSRSAFLA